MTRFVLLLCLAGCMVGPNYHKPEMEMPIAFEEKENGEMITDKDFCQWRQQFEDPLLNSLIEEAVCGNYDWRIALEQIIEARAQYRIEGSYLWPEIDLNAAATRSR